jgi:hypothetical protein
MMKTDRPDFDKWLSDFAEGKLSEKETGEVLRFIEENPGFADADFSLKITPYDDIVFSLKEDLKKSSSELTPSQFDQYAIAWLENDLDQDSRSELTGIMAANPGMKRNFDLILKTRLSPLPAIFKGKKALHKGNRFRVTAVFAIPLATSVAAAVLMIMLFPFMFRNHTGSETPMVPLAKQELILAPDSIELIPGPILKSTAGSLKQSGVNKHGIASGIPLPVAVPDSVTNLKKTLPDQDAIIPARPVPPSAILAMGKIPPAALAENRIDYPPEEEYAGMSTIEKFITRILRIKVLREDGRNTKPLSGYELARAGVTGINKLFGWEMALNEVSSGNGETSSINFKSKILNFSKPAKKTNPDR